jgi:hypothetical protein
MTAKSSNKSDPKSKSKGSEGDDYPNIAEEPIRVVGDKPRDKFKAGKPQPKSQKRSGKK